VEFAMTLFGQSLRHSRIETPQGNFLLYNGNAYGKDGFGVAVLK
jgi:hypothetical protein